MSKTEALQEIHHRWFEQCTCELRTSATQPVPGVGNADSPIVFIGEAPGKDEDIKGEPFIGRAGKFLTEMLESVGMKRSDVYITNTVKYRPPGNRDPLPAEKEACFLWLAEELNLIQPKLIIPLGRHALNNFIPEEKISQAHGKLLKKKVRLPLSNGTTVPLSTEFFFALYHPAAALYDGSMRETLIADFKKVPAVLEKISKYND